MSKHKVMVEEIIDQLMGLDTVKERIIKGVFEVGESTSREKISGQTKRPAAVK